MKTRTKLAISFVLVITFIFLMTLPPNAVKSATPSFAPLPEIPNENAKKSGCGEFEFYLRESDQTLHSLPKVGGKLPPHYVPVVFPGAPVIPPAPGGVYGDVRYSHIAANDLFLDHDWHDFNFYARLDEPAGNTLSLNSNANFANENSFLSTKDKRVMEVEWDSKYLPAEFWPTTGDKFWMTGNYIWDCGHDPYHTEIHSPTAVAFTRLEPMIWKDGETYSLTNKTYVYIHGRGGYINSPVANREYQFDVDLPPRPVGHTASPEAKVIALPFGGPEPRLEINTATNKVTVTYPLDLGDPSPNRRFAAIIASGWRTPSTSSVRFRKVTVNFEEIRVNRDHNPLCRADWKMWLNVNGHWVKIDGLAGISSHSLPVKIKKAVEVVLPNTADATLTLQLSGWVNDFDDAFGITNDWVKITQQAPKILQLANMLTTGGKVGLFFQQRTWAQNFGAIGMHDEDSARFEEINGEQTNDDRETEGDFTISYSITVADL